MRGVVPTVLCLGFWAACSAPPQPASAVPDYPTRFRENQTYRTVVPLVACIDHEPFSQLSVELQGPVDGPLPESEMPDSGGLANAYRSYEVFPAGTLIRILKVHPFYTYLDEGSTTEIAAVMASGPYRGKAVKLARICKRIVTPTLQQGFLVRDPVYLAPMD